MKILRCKQYSDKPKGYNCRGFLTTPIIASEDTLDKAIGEHEEVKKHWKNDKSIANLVRLGRSKINSELAKGEKKRRSKGRELVSDIKTKIEDREFSSVAYGHSVGDVDPDTLSSEKLTNNALAIRIKKTENLKKNWEKRDKNAPWYKKLIDYPQPFQKGHEAQLQEDYREAEKRGLKMKTFREKVPEDIARKGKSEGVIQKDKKGSWRIISYKKSQPEFWDAHYKSKADAESALGAYHANKH